MSYISAFTGSNIDNQVGKEFALKSELNTQINNIKTNYLLKSELLNSIYPVGSLYLSMSEVNPGTFLGGTWQRLTTDGYLRIAPTDREGETGGLWGHTHSTADLALTEAQMPVHKHKGVYWYGNQWPLSLNTSSGHNSYSLSFGYQNGTGILELHTIDAGGGAAHNHGNTGTSNVIPPYLMIALWQRTA